MRAGIIHVSLDMLRRELKLPPDIKLTCVRQSWEQQLEGVFEILVEGQSLPEVYPGQPIPWVTCSVESHYCKSHDTTHITKGHIESHIPGSPIHS